jgi:hypothetical protein
MGSDADVRPNDHVVPDLGAFADLYVSAADHMLPHVYPRSQGGLIGLSHAWLRKKMAAESVEVSPGLGAD